MRPNIPQLVYNLALERDLPALRELQAQGHCLTQLHHAFHHEFNAIAKLAFDGHGDAAEFLVDHLIGNPHDLVMGYAHAGNVHRTMFWMSDDICIEIAYIGFAYSGNIDAVNALLNKNIGIVPTCHYLALLGFAKGQHHALVQKFSNTEFNVAEQQPYHMNPDNALKFIVRGYAMAGDTKGLSLAENDNDLLKVYYEHSTIHTSFDTIPEDFQPFHFYKAAKFGDDEKILRHEDRFVHQLKHNIEEHYYAGGHIPCDSFKLKIPVYRIIKFLMNCYIELDYHPKHLSLTTQYLSDPLEDLLQANTYATNTYYDYSTYGIMSTRLSRYEATRTRELLQIDDDAKRQRLHWVTTTKSHLMTPKMTDNYAKIDRIHQIFKRTELGFNIAMKLGQDQQRLLDTLNLIMVSLHESAGALNTSLVVDSLLVELLVVTETDAVKIHSHFAGVFSKHLTRLSNPQSTLTQGNDTHAPKHPAAGL